MKKWLLIYCKDREFGSPHQAKICNNVIGIQVKCTSIITKYYKLFSFPNYNGNIFGVVVRDWSLEFAHDTISSLLA